MFGHSRSSHKILATRARELGLDDRRIAEQAGVDPGRVYDALKNDIDLEAILTVGEVKKILRVLDLDFLDVFGLACGFCRRTDGRFAELRSLARDELLAKRREQLGLSPDDLLVRVGVTRWFTENSEREWAKKRMALWRAIEDRPDSLDDLSLDQVRLLNKVLVVPLQLLLGVQCPTCGS